MLLHPNPREISPFVKQLVQYLPPLLSLPANKAKENPLEKHPKLSSKDILQKSRNTENWAGGGG